MAFYEWMGLLGALSNNAQLVLTAFGVSMTYVGRTSGIRGIGRFGIALTLLGVVAMVAIRGPGLGIF